MLLPTHLLTGQTAYLGACVVAQLPPQPIEALLAAAAGALPDLDHRSSLVGRLFPFLSEPLEHWVGHRTFTHSLLFQLTAGALAWWLLPAGFALAIIAGITSHAAADMMTPAGIGWFWPARHRCVLPGNPRYRMAPMGWGELAFLFVMAGLGLGMMKLSADTLGTGGVIQTALGDIAAARHDYDAQKGGNTWTLELQGRDNRRYSDISGSYQVIGPWKESGFIVQTDEGPRSTCRAISCDWYAEHAVLVRGERQRITSARFRAERIRSGALVEPLTRLQEYGELYLVGTVQGPHLTGELPAIEAGESEARLNYATPQDLEAWGDRLLERVELTIQLRHRPDITPPELPTGADVGGGELHPLLRKWVEK